MQMSALMSAHVVGFTGINEEIRLCAVKNALMDERLGVLGHYNRIVLSDDYLQLAFQVFGLFDEAGLGITSYHFQSMTGPPATPTLKISG